MRIGNHVLQRNRRAENEDSDIVSVHIRDEEVDQVADTLLYLNGNNEILAAIFVGKGWKNKAGTDVSNEEA